MPVASASARTQFTHLGLYTRRYGSFAGKASIALLDPAAGIMCVPAEDLTMLVKAESTVMDVPAEDLVMLVKTERKPC
jgi:hypothetical protein